MNRSHFLASATALAACAPTTPRLLIPPGPAILGPDGHPCDKRLGFAAPPWFFWSDGHNHTGQPALNYTIFDTHGYKNCSLYDRKHWTGAGAMQCYDKNGTQVYFQRRNGPSWAIYYPLPPGWTKGKIVKLWDDGFFHLGDGGYPGGTLRKRDTTRIVEAIHYGYGHARFTTFGPDDAPLLSVVAPFAWWKKKGNGDDNAGGCFDLVTDFGLGLAAGLMGCLTAEAVVGILGLASAAIQFAKAIKDVDECKEK